MAKRNYNMILDENNDVLAKNELLTDKELEKFRLNNPRRDWPREIRHVQVDSSDVFFFFGVRFSNRILKVLPFNTRL